MVDGSYYTHTPRLFHCSIHVSGKKKKKILKREGF